MDEYRYSQHLLFKALDFIRTANAELGGTLGEERVYAMLDAFDPALKGQLLLQLLFGNVTGAIVLRRNHSTSCDKIRAIKAVRAWTGLGLKEAKDATDIADRGQESTIAGNWDFDTRRALQNDLVGTGYEVI